MPRGGDQLTGLSPSNETLAPEKYQNYELGVKWDILPGFNLSAAIFQLDRENVLADTNGDGIQEPVGRQRTKGIELSAAGSVTDQPSLVGAYAYSDGTFLDNVSGTVQAGNIVPNMPKHSASLWTRFDPVEQIGAAVGIIYQGKRYASTDNLVSMPSYTRVDAALYYNISDTVSAQINVENIMWHAGRTASLCPAHARRVLARLECDVFPLIGGQPITGIRVAEVLDVLRRVEDRGAADITRRPKQNISQIFRFAMANDWTDKDPTIHLLGALKPPPRRRHMPRVDIAELPPLVSAIREYDREANSRRSETTRQALMFTLLTWARTGEVRFAIWSEFEGLDEPDRRLLWRVPAERMKMREEHLVPLPSQAEALVRERYLRNGKGRFVFGSADPDKPMSENTMIYACYRMGYHRRQTVHGFRGLASTWANESGRYRPDWIEVALAHDCRDKVRAAYNSARYLDSRRSMLQDWADYIEAAGERKRALDLGPAPTVGISAGFRHGLSLLGHNSG